MHASVCFITLFCSFLVVVAASLGDVEITNRVLFVPRHRRRSLVATDPGVTQTRVLTSLPYEYPQRRLTQEADDTCAWDASAEQCFLTAGTVLDYLDAVDNPLANYLNRAIPCVLQFDEEDCERENCAWNGAFCNIPHKEFREFISAPCLEEVRHIVDLQANAIQCGALQSRNRCERASPCTWVSFPFLGLPLQSWGYCVLDHWLYFHDIPMTDSYPEGFDEVYEERVDQLNEDLDVAYDNGDVVFTSDLLYFEPSEFKCPRKYEKILCDYVDAFTPVMLTDAYCLTTYPSIFDQALCSVDWNCQVTSDPLYPCEVRDSVQSIYSQDAEEIFAKAIEDPEARKYMRKATKCAYTEIEEDCGKNCVWIDNICGLSPKWAEEEAHRLIGETDNVVCQFYRSDVETGCLGHETVKDCTDDRQCIWLGDYNSCESGLYAWMDIALNGTDVQEAFRDTETSCFDNSLNECGVPDENDDFAAGSEEAPESLDIEYTYLSEAIGANMTVFALVF